MNNTETTAPQPIVGDAHLNVTDAPSTPTSAPGAEGVAAQASAPEASAPATETPAAANSFNSGESA